MADPEIANPHGIPSWALTKNGVQFLEYPERAGGRLPDFCIIGAAKCVILGLNDGKSCMLMHVHYMNAEKDISSIQLQVKTYYMGADQQKLRGYLTTEAELKDEKNKKMQDFTLTKLKDVLNKQKIKFEESLKHSAAIIGCENFKYCTDEVIKLVDGQFNKNAWDRAVLAEKRFKDKDYSIYEITAPWDDERDLD